MDSNPLGMRRQHLLSGGFFLGKVLIAVLLLTVVLTATATLVTVHLRYTTHQANNFRARCAAQSAVNVAIARLSTNQEYATDIARGDPSEDEEWTLLTFARDRPNFSTNNTRSAVAVEGSRGPVLPNTVHLVAFSQVRNAVYTADAVVYFPPYPYALASSGKVVSEGKLEVLGVDSLADLSDGVSEAERKPGHVVSNDIAESFAVTLSSQAVVEGEVRAVGGVNTGGAIVKGGVKAGQQEADLPEIQVSDYDPRKFNDAYSLELEPGQVVGQPGAFEVSSQRIRVNAGGSEVRFDNGVVLDDGLLFVEGDLHIRGGIKGKGAVVATGRIIVDGPSSLEGDMTALVSGGGVKIDGQGLGVSSFRGLVATLGDFEASSTSVLGAYLAVGKDPETRLGTSTMRLRDVQAVHAPEATAVDIVGHVELKEMLSGGQGNDDGSGSQVGLLLPDGTFYTFTGDPNASEADRDAQIQATYTALKGPTDGSPHPMTDGRVVIWRNGQEVPQKEAKYSAKIEREEMAKKWSSYLESVKAKKVVTVPIFSIDLNRFASGSSRIKILTYR